MTLWPNLSHNCYCAPTPKLHRQLGKTNAEDEAKTEAESVATVNKMREDESTAIESSRVESHLIGAVASCSNNNNNSNMQHRIFMMRRVWSMKYEVWSMKNDYAHA